MVNQDMREHVGNGSNEELAMRLAAELERHGIVAAVSVGQSVVQLEGVVDSVRQKRQAERILVELAPNLMPDNRLEVVRIVPVLEETEAEPDADDVESVLRQIEGNVVDEARSDWAMTVGSDDAEADGAGTSRPFFAPTDPVVRPALGGASVLGGFSATSLGETGDGFEAAHPGHRHGDEEIADTVRAELAEDALTADLQIHVWVRHGVVHLRGLVPSIEDAEAAEEVASRVPGVAEVDEQLDVVG